MSMIYDFITIGWWGSWLFCNINLPKNSKKLILEKNNIVGTKVLLSWWERANLTNINIDPEKDYFSCNKKAIHSFLHRFTNFDIINFFESNWVKTNIEDRGRVITASWNAKELVDVLLKKTIENNTIIKKWINIKKIYKKTWIYFIETNKLIFKTKNLIIATWWKSFSQVWTDWFWYKIARQFWLNIIKPYKSLVWLVLKQDLSFFSWTTIDVDVNLFYKKNKLVYNEFWPLLFTHFWLSWPIIYNLVTALWAYINCNNLDENYDNFTLKITIEKKNATKKIIKYFNIVEDSVELYFGIRDLKSWKEAKCTWWWVDTNELTKYLESKKHPWLFFIWELIDITWKTWGFNLQWAWSSAYACAEKFNIPQRV